MLFYKHYKSQHRKKPNNISTKSISNTNDQAERNITFWNKFGVVANIIAALSAAVTVYQAHSIWQKQLFIGRPYFSLKHPHFEEIAKTDTFEFVVTLENTGTRPAYETRVLVVGINPTIAKAPYKTYRLKISNPLSPSDEPTIRVPVYGFTINEPMQQFFIEIESYDSFLDLKNNQKFYLTWPGIKNRNAPEVLNHMSIDEQQIFVKTFGKFLSY